MTNRVQRIAAVIMKLSALLSLFTGCAKKPEPLPAAPGVSAQLHYPVLLVGEHRLVVKDNEESLTTTSVATGLNFPQFTLFDSNGARYAITKVTEFGKKSTFLDMGTSKFRVFLQLKASGKPNLDKAKSLLKEVMRSPGGIQDTRTASEAIDSAESFPQLIDLGRKSYEWR